MQWQDGDSTLRHAGDTASVWFLLAWLDCQEWGAGRNDQHRNGRGGFRFTGAFGYGMQRARRLKEALSRVYLLNRLPFDRESRDTSCDIHIDGPWVAVRYRGLFALGFKLEPDDDQLLARDILERRREEHIRGPVGCFVGVVGVDSGNTNSKEESKCRDMG